MTNRVQYDRHGMLDEVVTDAGMHLEVNGDDALFLIGFRTDGTEIAIHIAGRVQTVEERDMRSPDFEGMAFGRFKVSITIDGDVVLRRMGTLGRGAPRESRMWCIEQVEAALISARNRRGEDATCEARALEWAMDRLRKKGRRT